jgi:hypothetical protein
MLIYKSCFFERNEKLNIPNFLFVLVYLIIILSTQTALSQAIVSSDALPIFQIEARIRNGNSGFESLLATPSTPPPGQSGAGAIYLNPTGAPVWNSNGNVYGNIHTFLMNYNYLTGTTTWNIDFNRDGDYLDNQESVSKTDPTLISKGFKYINLFVQGHSSGLIAQVSNLSINGVNMGGFSSNSETAVTPLFTDLTGLFTNIEITGQFSIGGNGGQERPRIWVRLGTPNAPPTCSFVSPVNGVNLPSPANVSINAAAQDPDGNIVSVALLKNNIELLSDLIAPYDFNVNENEIGQVNYQIKAIDNLGAQCFSDLLLNITACIPEDIDADGVVNTNDFLSLIGLFGQNCNNCAQDIDHNGIVNTSDFLLLIAKFNFICPN